jgi:predicted secreted hydrolase
VSRQAQGGCALLLVLLAIGALLGAQSPSWRLATTPHPSRFPSDHGSHPDYRLEWWYYTGNLDGADGRRYGFQVTFFRIGIDPAPLNRSAWTVRDLYMTHVAISDPSSGRYLSEQRLSRAGPGLAGASVDRLLVWNEDWRTSRDEKGVHRVSVAAADFSLDLYLDEARRPTLNGVMGLSRKGPSEGNASHYYSLTRMPTRGHVAIDGRAVQVTGLSWMDREFGTSFLEADQQGWDWFALHLNDGSDLMIYQLRRRDGSRDLHSSGTWTRADGRVTPLPHDSFSLRSTGASFQSRRTGARYPTSWQLDIPAERLRLSITTPLADQELVADDATGVAYWEGLVDARGQRGGQPVTGRGYLEMTGYAGPAMGNFFR